MRQFEISSKKSKNGRRKFKAILYTIFPDSCVDEENQVGTEFNRNGITWIREYCEKALSSIEGMSLRVEFTDDERTEILGHGETGIVNNEPTYENAVQIGTFTKGYIDEIETDEGIITACIGEGEIDAQCYHNYVTKLENDAAQGIFPNGSVEIMHSENNKYIIYKYGFKEEGRIPMDFIHSGYVLLGVTPADDNAKLIELNNNSNKEDLDKMTDVEMKALITQAIEEFSNQTAEMNKCKEECQAKIDAVIAEKNEIVASSAEIQAALDKVRAEYEALDKKYNELWAERETLNKALAEAKAKERIGELNKAINDFSEDERKYAEAEIKAFNDDPMSCEINTVVDKIWQEIGKNAKATEKKVAEQNNDTVAVEDIFSEVIDTAEATEDVNIF
ncbi:MAG: hypothetical protein II453_18110 [Alphaproteobacteria bacterium]|nr:hypothetical protein [Alphaproteobacteria bacterium]